MDQVEGKYILRMSNDGKNKINTLFRQLHQKLIWLNVDYQIKTPCYIGLTFLDDLVYDIKSRCTICSYIIKAPETSSLWSWTLSQNFIQGWTVKRFHVVWFFTKDSYICKMLEMTDCPYGKVTLSPFSSFIPFIPWELTYTRQVKWTCNCILKMNLNVSCNVKYRHSQKKQEEL